MDCSQLYISTVSAGCDETTARYGLGLEIAEYCGRHFLNCFSAASYASVRPFSAMTFCRIASGSLPWMSSPSARSSRVAGMPK